MFYLDVFMSAGIALLMNVLILVYIGKYSGFRKSLSHHIQLTGLFGLILSGVLVNLSNGIYCSNVLFFTSIMVMILMVFIDYQVMIIPDTLNGLLIFAILVGRFLKLDHFTISSWESGLIGMGIGFGIFFLIALVTGGMMGGGDIKLMAVLGLWMGAINIWIVTLLAFVLGAVISVGLLILKIKGRKDMIPFGPFIILAALLVLFLGDSIINMYLKFL
ncbi:MAG: prepilin peptidase [Clostridiales bacterium]|nr:prepilin peptidase [Clostridiales bacterium]